LSNRRFNRFVLVILLITNISLSAQPPADIIHSKTDSIRHLLPGSDINQKVDLLNELSSIYAPLNFDSAITYAVQAQRIGTVNAYPLGVGIARLNTGNAYYYRMDLKNALLSYLAALKVLEEFKPLKELGDLYMQLGNINYFIGRTEKAISFFHQAGQNYRSTGNDRESLQEPFAIFFTYLISHQLDSALVYCERFVNSARKLDDKYLEAHGLNPMGWIYMEMDDIDQKQKALHCFHSSLEIGTELKNEILISTNNLCLGNYYDRSTPLFEVTGNLKVARAYHEKALEAAVKANNPFLQAAILDYLAAIDIEEKKDDQAHDNLAKSMQCLKIFLDNPLKNDPVSPYLAFGKMVDYILIMRERIKLYGLLYDLAMARGEFLAAIKYLRLQYQFSDSMYSEQQSRQFELIMTEAEQERTDQKMRTLEQENELNQLRLNRSRFISAGIGAFVVIISLSILLFFQRKRLKAEQKSISMEQRLLRAQMNPHFLFNSLASIQNYIINEDTDQASIYLSRFSQLVRNILDNSQEEYVTLDKEIQTVENYLELQKVRFAGKFDYNIDIDTDIDTENALIPPMLAQPFIENAIEHGIRHKTGSGHIEIRFLMEDGTIRFEVEDDGVGREKAREIEALQGRKHRSMATSITIDRLASINRKQKKKIRLEITDLKDDKDVGCGTRVRFGIPVSGRI
jgi:tetratricopeptide (TPR) repeat protein